MPAPAKRVRITKMVAAGMAGGALLWNADVPGFAARRLAASTVYVLMCRTGGRQRWFTIGRHGSPWTVQTARDPIQPLLRDLLMELATTELFRAKWSWAIHEEWTRNPLRSRPDLPPTAPVIG